MLNVKDRDRSVMYLPSQKEFLLIQIKNKEQLKLGPCEVGSRKI